MKRYFTNSTDEWVKIRYKVMRENIVSREIRGETSVTILKDFADYQHLRSKLKWFFKDFTGKGEVTITSLVSSFGLTDKESKYFVGRVFKFNRYQSFLK